MIHLLGSVEVPPMTLAELAAVALILCTALWVAIGTADRIAGWRERRQR